MTKYIIYKAQCGVNKKSFVGSAPYDVSHKFASIPHTKVALRSFRRVCDPRWLGERPHLSYDINFYGRHFFKVEVLQRDILKRDLTDLLYEWIETLKTWDCKNGYNQKKRDSK